MPRSDEDHDAEGGRATKRRYLHETEQYLTVFPSPNPNLQCVELEQMKPVKQIKEVEGKVKTEEAPSVAFYKLFSFADSYDVLLIFLGTLGACVHGIAIPIFFIFFGKLIDAFGKYDNDPEKMSAEVSKVWILNPRSNIHLRCSFLTSCPRLW